MPPLGQPRGDVDAVLLGWIVINVEVVGFQNLKIEFLVLDLVLSEVLRPDWRGEEGHDDGQGKEASSALQECARCSGLHSSSRGCKRCTFSGLAETSTAGCRRDQGAPHNSRRWPCRLPAEPRAPLARAQNRSPRSTRDRPDILR